MNDPKRQTTILEWLDENCPPFAVYFFARANGNWAGPRLIALRSGLTYRTVKRVGSMIAWAGVDTDVMSAFINGCGFRLCARGIVRLNLTNAYRRYASKKAVRPMRHLNDSEWEIFDRRAAWWLANHR